MKKIHFQIKEIVDDANKLSDEDWTKKYGDKCYWEVIEELFIEQDRKSF